MMTQKVEEYNAVCKETMDCIMEQFKTDAFMEMDANTLKLMQNMVKLVNAGTEVMKSEAETLDRIDKKLDGLNARLLSTTRI